MKGFKGLRSKGLRLIGVKVQRFRVHVLKPEAPVLEPYPLHSYLLVVGRE